MPSGKGRGAGAMANDGLKTEWISYEEIAKVMFGRYESIIDIEAKTNRYLVFHESCEYRSLELSKEGDDFFDALADNIENINSDDRDYVMAMLDKETLMSSLRDEEYYSFIYRIHKEGKDIYHQIRATSITVGGSGKEHILIGIRNVDKMMKRELKHRREIEAMKQKEDNHMTALLASAMAYTEANLTEDIVLRRAQGENPDISLPSSNGLKRYSELQKWIADNIVVMNKKGFEEASSREALLKVFGNGGKIASAAYSIRTLRGDVQPCRELFFLYQNSISKDIHLFSVVYDLSEQQKKEQEMKSLEEELRLSRIHNSTSQMQPHFLYNALGSIQELILTDPGSAADVLEAFTIHLKSCVRAMSSDEPVSFSSELENIKAYIDIEKMRLGEKLQVVYDIPSTDFQIVPLSIQPLVENAIRHGIYQRGKEGGTLTVKVTETEENWQISVSDDGVGFDSERFFKESADGLHESTGLINIMFRLKKVMNADVHVQSEIGVGTVVTVILPIEV